MTPVVHCKPRIGKMIPGARSLNGPFKELAKSSSVIGAIALVLVICGAIAFRVGIPMTSDPAWGFMVLDSMHRGSGFNVLVFPDPSNIAVDTQKFVTGWSPGQYLIPGAFTAIGFSLGHSLVLTSTLFSIAGVLGWYVFYKAVGFPLKTVAASCLLMIFTQWFLQSMNVYYGGENLILGAAPWIALIFWRLRRLPLPAAVPLFTVLVAAAFIKLSAVIFALALLAACLFSQGLKPFPNFCRRALTAGVVFAGFTGLFYVEWIERGPTAATTVVSGPGFSLISLAFPVVGQAASVFGFTNFLDRLLLCPCRPGLPSPDTIIDLVLPLAVAAYLFIRMRLAADPKLREYADFASIAFLSSTCVFVALFFAKSAVSFDERHFREIGLLLLPAILQTTLQSGSAIMRHGMRTIIAGSLLYGAYIYYLSVKQNLALALNAQGFRDDRASALVLGSMHGRLASEEGGSAPVLYVQSPMLALEFPAARRIVPFDSEDEPLDVLASRRYRGHVGRTYVLLPKSMVQNGKAAAILRSFVDYDPTEWQATALDNYVCFTQTVRAPVLAN